VSADSASDPVPRGREKNPPSAGSVTDPVSADLEKNPASAGAAACPLPVCSGQVSPLSAGRDSVALFCGQEELSAGAVSAASGMLVIAASNGPRLP
jgi:hypothetical protein